MSREKRTRRVRKTKGSGNEVSLFLDSGAFSAWSKGHEINIDDYADFIDEYIEYLTVYANLDVIGDPEATYKNQKYLEEERGLKPLPCFHFGTDVTFLERYLSEGYEYLALGGMVGTPAKKLIPWLDYLFSEYLTDSEGYPLLNIHGFGVTSLKLLLRFPWYSVDSTSWVKTGRFGSVMVPVRRNGKYDYSLIPHKVVTSDKSPKKEFDGQHFSTFNPLVQNHIRHYFEMKGYTYEELSEDYQKRDELNIHYFLDLEKNLKDKPFDRSIVRGSFF
jgi:hypothetical protein